jgi:hypothetical protein
MYDNGCTLVVTTSHACLRYSTYNFPSTGDFRGRSDIHTIRGAIPDITVRPCIDFSHIIYLTAAFLPSLGGWQAAAVAKELLFARGILPRSLREPIPRSINNMTLSNTMSRTIGLMLYPSLNVISRRSDGKTFVICVSNPSSARQAERYIVCFSDGRSFEVPVVWDAPNFVYG